MCVCVQKSASGQGEPPTSPQKVGQFEEKVQGRPTTDELQNMTKCAWMSSQLLQNVLIPM